jgi:hypothetical protein
MNKQTSMLRILAATKLREMDWQMAAGREIGQHKCPGHNMKLKDRRKGSNTNWTRNEPVVSMDLPRVSRARHGVRYDQLLSKIERPPVMFLGFDEGLQLRDKEAS